MIRAYLVAVAIASILFGIIGYVAFDARSDNSDQQRDLTASICSTANSVALAFREPQFGESDHHFELRLQAQRRSLRASLSLRCDIPGFAPARARALRQIDAILTRREQRQEQNSPDPSTGGDDAPGNPPSGDAPADPPADAPVGDGGDGDDGGNGVDQPPSDPGDGDPPAAPPTTPPVDQPPADSASPPTVGGLGITTPVDPIVCNLPVRLCR